MSFTSWLTESELFDDLDLNERKHQPQPEPIHSRPSLECLEERTLLNANNGLVEGSFHNLNMNNNFNFGSNGIVLPQQNLSGPSDNGAMGSNGIHAFDPSGRVSSGTTGEASSAAFLAQDQLYGQFRVFGINSQGPDGRQIQQTTDFILRDAFGFGSGTQPNAPWKPNAYNLGLANHQANYSTQADNGFSSVPPWARQGGSPVAQSQQNNQNRLVDDNDQLHFLNKDEQETEESEQLTARHTTSEEKQPPQHRLDLDVGDKDDEMQALIEQQASEKKAPVEKAVPADEAIPDAVLLSTLAPAQMAALVAGLPGMPAAAGGGEAGAEGGDLAVAAPE